MKLNVTSGLWLLVIGLIVTMLAIDLFAHRKASVISLREAAIWSAVWVSLGLGFGAFIWTTYGAEFGQEYLSGFVIEKSLAVDNVFVWALIFSAFAVPREYQHRVLFLGVIGALVLRAIFIAGGAALLETYGWVLYLFAAFLIYTGIKMAIQRNEHWDPQSSKFLALLQRRVPSTNLYYGQRFFVKLNGKRLATPLLIVLLLVEFTDIVFAVDSIPAIFAVTDEVFIVFAANAFAVLGLRAMYFLLADLMHRFVYLKVGLALILVWVGIKMALHDFYKIPTTLSLGVIVAILALAIGVSVWKTKGLDTPRIEGQSPSYRSATEAELAEVESRA